jgi:hypothetical protein
LRRKMGSGMFYKNGNQLWLKIMMIEEH